MQAAKLLVNGLNFEGFESISIDRSIDSLAGTFSLTFYDKWLVSNGPWGIIPGDKCEMIVGDKTMIRGYVDSLSVSANTSRSLRVSGRDKTSDLIDCSFDSKAYEFSGLTLIQFLKKLCDPFGVRVVADIPESQLKTPIEIDSVQPGESVYEVISRVASKRNLIINSTRFGNLHITRPTSAVLEGILIEGENIKSIDVNIDHRDRFSEYSVLFQESVGGDLFSTDSSSQSVVSKDKSIRRYRPKTIVYDGKAELSSAGNRAKFELNSRRAMSTSINVTVVGWLNRSGEPWLPNSIVRVMSPTIRVDDKYLIKSVSLSKDLSGGSVAKLALTSTKYFQDIKDLQTPQKRPSFSKTLSDIMGSD